MFSNSCDVPTEPLRRRASYSAALFGAEECSMVIVGWWGDVMFGKRWGGGRGSEKR